MSPRPRALITGASSGLGSGYARTLAAEGYDLVLVARGEARLESLAAQLRTTQNIHAEAAVADLSTRDGIDAVNEIIETQPIDVLINNAGFGGENELVDMTDEDWDRVLDITLNGTFRATRAALRYFRDVPHNGVIVNNASVLGWRAQRAQAHYAAAKAGVMALTRSSAIEGADFGVRINAVAPSIARHKFLEKSASSELLDELASKEAFGRAADVWEVAATIAMLASDYTTYLTGEVISISSQRA